MRDTAGVAADQRTLWSLLIDSAVLYGVKSIANYMTLCFYEPMNSAWRVSLRGRQRSAIETHAPCCGGRLAHPKFGSGGQPLPTTAFLPKPAQGTPLILVFARENSLHDQTSQSTSCSGTRGAYAACAWGEQKKTRRRATGAAPCHHHGSAAAASSMTAIQAPPAAPAATGNAK